MNTKRMQKGHSEQKKFRGWRHPFAYAPKIVKIVENLENKLEKNGIIPKGLVE